MATTISVADDVYKYMKRKKGDRSFSEFIRQFIGETDFGEIEGSGFSKNWERTEEVLKDASEKSHENLEKTYDN